MRIVEALISGGANAPEMYAWVTVSSDGEVSTGRVYATQDEALTDFRKHMKTSLSVVLTQRGERWVVNAIVPLINESV